MRPKKTSQDPVLNILAMWIEEGLPADVEAHLLAVGRAVGRELEGASVMQRGAAAAWLTLYRRLREDSGGGALTAARGLAELVRAGRLLGLVKALDPQRPRRMNGPRPQSMWEQGGAEAAPAAPGQAIFSSRREPVDDAPEPSEDNEEQDDGLAVAGEDGND